MDWLFARKSLIEKKLAGRHLQSWSLVLYDLSSSYVEGACCMLAKFGYNRDLKRGKKQVNYGLLTDDRGCPIAIDIYEGNTKDSATLLDQIDKLKNKFKINNIVIVGDRGMITKGHIEQFKTMTDIDWITALRNQQVQVIVANQDIDETSTLFEIEHSDYPDERLVVCRNPQLVKKRHCDRQSLIAKTEKQLKKIQTIIKNGKLSGKGRIGISIGKEINKFKVAKLFELTIKEKSFVYKINQEKLNKEQLTDGIYVIRSSLKKSKMNSGDVVRSYKQLCNVEQAFHSIKTIDLRVRPIYHYDDNRVKAHIFICMLAYYIEWHLKEVWRPLLFGDEETNLKKIRDPVLPARVSASAREKASIKKTKDGAVVYSFRSLLNHLGTIMRNTCKYADEETIVIDTKLNEIQQKAFDLIENINIL